MGLHSGLCGNPTHRPNPGRALLRATLIAQGAHTPASPLPRARPCAPWGVYCALRLLPIPLICAEIALVYAPLRATG